MAPGFCNLSIVHNKIAGTITTSFRTYIKTAFVKAYNCGLLQGLLSLYFGATHCRNCTWQLSINKYSPGIFMNNTSTWVRGNSISFSYSPEKLPNPFTSRRYARSLSTRREKYVSRLVATGDIVLM